MVPRCSVCHSVLRNFQKCHCRLCGSCVCFACSPHLVQVDTALRQRACKLCIDFSSKRCAIEKRLRQVGDHLSTISGPLQHSSCPQNVEAATSFCEFAAVAIVDAVTEQRKVDKAREVEFVASRETLAEEAGFAKGFILSMGIRLHALHCGKEPCILRADDLQEVAAYCNAAVDPLSDVLGSCRRSRRSSPSPKTSFLPRSSQHSGVACASKVSLWNTLVSTVLREVCDCHVCRSKLGKRFFRRKYACQLCQKSVCSACSPSRLLFQRGGRFQRVCTPCSSSLPSLFAIQKSLVQFTEKIVASSQATI